MSQASQRRIIRKWRADDWAGLALGFGLGGFFDGILLHHILQWHHLLSGLDQAQFDIRTLVLADGLFHAAMYIVTAGGLVLLWKSSRSPDASGGKQLIARALVGFGAWHMLDGILSHWLFGLHRVRMDVENPLFWDILWIVVFGLAPLVVGWLSDRSNRGPPASRTVVTGLALFAVTAGAVASWTPNGPRTVMVQFRSDIPEAQAFRAMQAAGGRLRWIDDSGTLWAMEVPAGGTSSARLYAGGALYVSSSFI
jgi:uncharacterized membrane protein